MGVVLANSLDLAGPPGQPTFLDVSAAGVDITFAVSGIENNQFRSTPPSGWSQWDNEQGKQQSEGVTAHWLLHMQGIRRAAKARLVVHDQRGYFYRSLG